MGGGGKHIIFARTPRQKIIFPKNLWILPPPNLLHDKKVQEKASSPYAALRAALQNFSPFQTSHIRVTLYDQIRTYFKNL
jgi:hypothetical protein